MPDPASGDHLSRPMSLDKKPALLPLEHVVCGNAETEESFMLFSLLIWSPKLNFTYILVIKLVLHSINTYTLNSKIYLSFLKSCRYEVAHLLEKIEHLETSKRSVDSASSHPSFGF